VYKNETDKDNWERQEVFSSNISINGKAELLAELLTDSEPGTYLVEAISISENNDTTEAKKYFTLYSSASKHLLGKMLNWSMVSKSKAEPGEVVQLLFGSAAKKTKV